MQEKTLTENIKYKETIKDLTRRNRVGKQKLQWNENKYNTKRRCKIKVS